MDRDAESQSGIDHDRPEDKGKPIEAQEVVRRYEEASKATRRQAMAYYKACAFLEGDQWLRSNTEDTRLERIPPRRRPDGTDGILAVNNRLTPASVTVMAKLHRRPHEFECPPSSGDAAAVLGANLSKSVLADIQRRQNWDAIRTQGDWMAWKGGTSVICVEWDAEAGPELAYDRTPGEGTTAPQVAGDVCVSALSVAEAYFEGGTRDARKAFWWIKAVVMPPKTVRRLFDLKEDPEADGKTFVKYDPGQWRSGTAADADQTLVLTLFERPHKDCPYGRVVTVVNEKIVGEEKPWPFPWDDHLNIREITAVPVDNRWNGQTVLWHAMSLQYLLNCCESAIAEHQHAMGYAQLWIPQGSVDADTDLSPDPYRPRYFNSGPGMEKPFYMSPPPMPEWVMRGPERYALAIDDVVGVHAVSRGDAPQGVESGVALSFLGEQDDTPVGELARVSAAAWADVASDVLALYEEYVKEQREVQVNQPAGPPQTMQWSGEMLAGQTKAEIPADSAAPRGRFALLQLALNMLDRGVFGPVGEPDTTKRFIRYADMPGFEDMLGAIDHHEAKALREAAKMFAGVPCVPEPFDDHATCIRVANEARLSERYEQADEEIQALFNDYTLAHQMLSEEEMAKQEAKVLAGSPAMAVAAQAHEPALAGDPEALVQMQAEQDQVAHRGANVGGADAPIAPEMTPRDVGAEMAGAPGPGEGNG